MQQQITLDEILTEFFSRYNNILMVEVMRKVVSKEESGEFLDSIFKITEKSFQTFSEQIAKSDMNFYLEFKKHLGATYDQMKSTIVSTYDRPNELVEVAEEIGKKEESKIILAN